MPVQFEIKPTYAKAYNLDISFSGKILLETSRVIYIHPMNSTPIWIPLSMVIARRKAEELKEFILRMAELWNGVIKLTFPYDSKDIINVKKIAWRKYHKDGKFWTCPLKKSTLTSLQDWGFILSKELAHILNIDSGGLPPLLDLELPDILTHPNLYPYQKQGVALIELLKGRVLLADEMGLGKTIQALAYIDLHPDNFPVVIVCPAVVKYVWESLAKVWLTNPDILILSGRTPNIKKITNKIIIINYDILSYWVPILKKSKPHLIITDECHYYKNSKAARTKAVKKLVKSTPEFIAISGTPITSRPMEFFTALNLLLPDSFSNFTEYAQEYCDASFDGRQWSYKGASNIMKLHKILTSTIMIRRKKKDVLKDLPDKTKVIIAVDITNRKEYLRAEQNVINYIRQTKGDYAANKAAVAETIVQIGVLKQLAAVGKMTQAFEWIDNFLETGQKLTIYAVHKVIIATLMERYEKISVKIDGSVANNKREGIVNEFQTNPKIRLFIGNMGAAGIGITLTVASNMLILEFPWTPSELDQVEDRIHRISQKEAVFIYNLVGKNTIDETIIDLLNEKSRVISGIMDGVSRDHFIQASIFPDLVQKLSKNK